MRRKVEHDVALAVLALSLGVIGAACSSSNESPKVSASASATAGRVLEVAGKVTVADKQLAKNDSVGADDVIDTGADGSVTIELAHNRARWELGPGKHLRVRESLAWNEPKRTEPVAQVEQATASGGRPVERNAAGTVASSADGDKLTKDDEDDEETAAVKDKSDGGGGGDLGSGGLGIKGTGVGGGGTGEGTIGTGTIGTIGKGGGGGYGTGAGKLGSKTTTTTTLRPGTPQVQGSLPPEVIRRIVRSRFGQLRFCYEKGLKANPTLAGRVSVKLVIDKDGAVPTAQAADETLSDATVVSCIVGVFKAMKFPKPQGGGIVVVTYPIVFDPGQ